MTRRPHYLSLDIPLSTATALSCEITRHNSRLWQVVLLFSLSPHTPDGNPSSNLMAFFPCDQVCHHLTDPVSAMQPLGKFPFDKIEYLSK